MEEKLIPAPIDDKNVMTDWIEEMFDDCFCVADYKNNQILGFIELCPVHVKWYRNRLEWHFVDHQVDNKSAIDILTKKTRRESKSQPRIITRLVCDWRRHRTKILLARQVNHWRSSPPLITKCFTKNK